MTPPSPDFAADGFAQRKSVADRSALIPPVERVATIKDIIKSLEQDIKDYRSEMNTLIRETVVRIMDELGQSKVQLADGTKVGIDDFMELSIPSETKINDAETEEERDELIARRARCMEWLDAHQLGSLVSNQVIIDCGKGDNLVNLVKDFCKENDLTHEHKRAIHPGTLKKGVKELYDRDAILPPAEDFALVVGRTAKITPPKQPK